MAWMTAHLLRPWCEKPLTPGDLLGRPRPDQAAHDAEEMAAFIGAPSGTTYEDVMAHQARIRAAHA